jgi:hypothetical protein
VQHIRSERGEHHLVVRHRRSGGVELVEVVDHLAVGTGVALVGALDCGSVAHAEPEKEPSRMPVGQRCVAGRDVDRVVHPDVEDARRHDHPDRRVHEPK